MKKMEESGGKKEKMEGVFTFNLGDHKRHFSGWEP